MILAPKIALDPNNAQATYFAKAAGTARFAYNWALTEWQRQYEAWKADNSLPDASHRRRVVMDTPNTAAASLVLTNLSILERIA